MTKLNLTAKGREQELILAYLQENASETLADKINNGAEIEHNGQRVLNKKTLDGFMQFAADEAKKLAEKGARSACVEDATVYGWAVHYFEEDAIIGKLYTLDGKELTPEPKRTATPKTVAPAKPAQPQKAQMSIFGMMAENTPAAPEPDDDEPNEDDDDIDDGDEADDDTMSEPDGEETVGEEDDDEADNDPDEQGTPFYQNYRKFAAKYADAVLFQRLGDFYEALGDHAVKISEALGLTLTGRDCGLKNRIPMCGVPYHAFEPYITKLLERGYKVAVAEDLLGYRFMYSTTESIDGETGELLPEKPQEKQEEQDDGDPMDGFDASAFDTEALCILSDLFGDDIDVR